MPNITYPVDYTGTATSNKITEELHTLTEINDVTYNILIPDAAPFHVENFALVHIAANGTRRTLTEGVDYYFTLPYVAAIRSLGKVIYGGVTILNHTIAGTLAATYQTLGGSWTADRNYVLNYLIERAYNPRTTIWDVVTNVQQLFPPIVHNQEFDYVFGHGELIDAINGISDTLANSDLSHETNYGNPHRVNKTQVGLGNVDNTSDAQKPISLAVQTALNNKADLHHTHDDLLVLGDNHSHQITSVIGLQNELNNKANISHTHDIADVPNFESALNDKANLQHNHVVSNITGLQAALDTKSNTNHTHQLKTILHQTLTGNGNIDLKTINGVNLLGPGNIEILSGSGETGGINVLHYENLTFAVTHVRAATGDVQNKSVSISVNIPNDNNVYLAILNPELPTDAYIESKNVYSIKHNDIALFDNTTNFIPYRYGNDYTRILSSGTNTFELEIIMHEISTSRTLKCPIIVVKILNEVPPGPKGDKGDTGDPGPAGSIVIADPDSNSYPIGSFLPAANNHQVYRFSIPNFGTGTLYKVVMGGNSSSIFFTSNIDKYSSPFFTVTSIPGTWKCIYTSVDTYQDTPQGESSPQTVENYNSLFQRIS